MTTILALKTDSCVVMASDGLMCNEHRRILKNMVVRLSGEA